MFRKKKIKSKRDILNAIAALTQKISITASQEEFIEGFTRELKATFPFQHFIIWILNEGLMKFFPLYSTIPCSENLSSDDVPLAEHSGKEDRVILINNFSKEKNYTPCLEKGLSAIAIPLSSFGKVRGVLHIESHLRNYFDRETIMLLTVFANQLAVVIRNHYLFEQVSSLKNYLDTLVEKANAIMVIMDSLGRIKRVNEAAERFLGYKREELIGSLVVNFLTSDDKKRLLLPLQQAIRRGEFVSGIEEEIVTRSGEKRFGLFNLGGIFESHGRLREIIVVGQDITRAKETEMKLMQAEKLAMLGQIASSIVHEINNPLALVSSSAQVILKKARAEGRSDDENKISLILEGVDRLQKFVQNLMNFARPSIDEIGNVDLNESIEESLRWIEHMARRGNVNIIKRLDTTLPLARGNKTEIQQVFLNLMSNAFHAMEKKEGNVIISTEKVNNGYVAFQISDEGTGIKKEELSHIFEPFFSTKIKGKGTGLGLSIVQRIVERHEGKIAVKSEEGMGTTVKITLPSARGGQR